MRPGSSERVDKRSFLVPAIAVCVVGIQMLCANLSTLTAWKGGGFGMFATIDNPRTRFIVVDAVDTSGKSYRVDVPYGRFLEIRELGRRYANQLLAFPTSSGLHGLARVISESSLRAVDPENTEVPVALQRVLFDPPLAPLLGALRRAQLTQPTRIGRPAIEVNEVRASVLGLRYDRRRQVAVLERLASATVNVTFQQRAQPK